MFYLDGQKLIPIKKDDLLAALRTNRSAHRAVFEKAVEQYRTEVVDRLNAMLEDVKANRRIDQYVGLIQPQDQTREYDRAIRMLELMTEDVAHLTEEEFAQFVMDDWGWKAQWVTSTLNYANKR